MFFPPHSLLSKQYWLFDLVGLLFTCSLAGAWWWVYRAQESSSPALASGSLSGGCSSSSAPAGTPSGPMWSGACSSQLPRRTYRTDQRSEVESVSKSVFLNDIAWDEERAERTPWPFQCNNLKLESSFNNDSMQTNLAVIPSLSSNLEKCTALFHASNVL